MEVRKSSPEGSEALPGAGCPEELWVQWAGDSLGCWRGRAHSRGGMGWASRSLPTETIPCFSDPVVFCSERIFLKALLERIHTLKGQQTSFS